jgi:L-fuconolactonase
MAMMPKIDAHHHCWKYQPRKHAWIDDSMQGIRRDFGPEDLQVSLEQNDVVGTVIVQVDQEPEGNHFMLSIAQTSSFVKGIVGWIDLLAPDLSEQLDMWSAEPLMKGFRHIAQAEPDDFLARPGIIKGIGQLGTFDFSYDILIKPPQLEAALLLVRALPNQAFVINHLAKPYIAAGEIDTWAKNIRAFAAFPNVYCKISGMVTEADWRHWTNAQFFPYMEVVLEAFGTYRLMFGSDWPVCLVAASYDAVVNTTRQFLKDLSEKEREAIWYKNAERFYRLNLKHGSAIKR